MLFRWKALADAAGVDRFSARRPNLVISSGYQVCWEKFCRYWDIEMRLVPLDATHLSLNMETVMSEEEEEKLIGQRIDEEAKPYVRRLAQLEEKVRDLTNYFHE